MLLEVIFFNGASRDEVLLPMRLSQTYCGMEELAHFSCHDVIKNPKFELDKKRFIEHLKNVFEIK